LPRASTDHGADADQDGFDGYSAKLDNPGEPDGSLTGNSRSGQKQGRLVGSPAVVSELASVSRRSDAPRLRASLVAPEVLESVWRRLRVAPRMLDVAMAEPCLQGPRIVPGIRPGEAVRVPQHVRVDRKRHASTLAERAARESSLGVMGATALGSEHMRAWRLFAPPR
jgi:hypothetical protein